MQFVYQNLYFFLRHTTLASIAAQRQFFPILRILELLPFMLTITVHPKYAARSSEAILANALADVIFMPLSVKTFAISSRFNPLMTTIPAC